MNFIEAYEAEIAANSLEHDLEQQPLILELDRLAQEITATKKVSARAPWSTHWQKLTRSKPSLEPIPGVYIWGDVGRGKTHLMNVFYDSLPFKDKWRIHYHRFMQWVHEQSGRYANLQDPLKRIAQRVASKNRILCLDEFMVTDIADAMILNGLLKNLFEAGVTLVTTANCHPDELYKNGLQRAHFLPAIDLLKTHTVVINVDGERDYRKRAWICEDIYYTPLGEAAENGLGRCYQRLATQPEIKASEIMVAGRPIIVHSVSEDIVWFDFHHICQTTRSQKDYIQLSNQFQTIIISNVPELSKDDDDAARRLINLIDTAYDYGTNLLVSAAKPPELIYTGSRLQKAFKRAASRLWEMSTKEYLINSRQGISP